jgi:hypothetical protein
MTATSSTAHEGNKEQERHSFGRATKMLKYDWSLGF